MSESSSCSCAGELLLPVGWGEFLDRLAIQELKAERLPDNGPREHAARLLSRMRALLDARSSLPEEALLLMQELRAVNGSLWETESAVRTARRDWKRSGLTEDMARFSELAQAILAGNERRADIKQRIDSLMGHPPEAKHYSGEPC